MTKPRQTEQVVTNSSGVRKVYHHSGDVRTETASNAWLVRRRESEGGRQCGSNFQHQVCMASMIGVKNLEQLELAKEAEVPIENLQVPLYQPQIPQTLSLEQYKDSTCIKWF